MTYQTVGDVCRQHFGGVPPKIVSDMLYRRELPGADESCPVVGGRRMIPTTYVETIAIALRRAGRIPRREVAAR